MKTKIRDSHTGEFKECCVDLKMLEEFLTRVVKSGMTLKAPKAIHAKEKMEALGFVYGDGEMTLTPIYQAVGGGGS